MEVVSELHTTLKEKYTIQQVLKKISEWELVFEARKKNTGDMVAILVSQHVNVGYVLGAKQWNDVAVRIALQHPNILEVSDFYYNRERRSLNIISPLMETDLHAVVRAKILKPVHIQYIAYQLLEALSYIHYNRFIVTDLKVTNVLLNADCTIKLKGFKSVMRCDELVKSSDSEYYKTRYRPPEALVYGEVKTTATDMWCLGLLVGEMITGSPMVPHWSDFNILQRILDINGPPTEEDISSWGSPIGEAMVGALNTGEQRSMSEVLGEDTTDDARDFVRQCIAWNPEARMSAEEALAHPFVCMFHDGDTSLLRPAEEVKLVPLYGSKSDDRRWRNLHRRMKAKRKASRRDRQLRSERVRVLLMISRFTESLVSMLPFEVLVIIASFVREKDVAWGGRQERKLRKMQSMAER